MKLKFIAWIAVAASTILLPPAQAQLNRPKTASNQVAAAKSKVPTNAPVAVVIKPVPVLTNAEPKIAQIPGLQYTNGVGMELVKTPGGFWAGVYEVTQKQYQEVMGVNPSAFSGEKRPVDNLSWNDAVEFCQKLTVKEILETNLPAGFVYTLPSEGQWQSLLADASLADAVTSQATPRAATAVVGSLGANSLGLYDLRGNVMEFTLSDTSKPYRVLHGGSWHDRIEINLRPDFRNYCPPDEHKNTYGFRCVLIPALTR
jgi:formylglycine-generating enzyme required for sulfatase activity